MFKIKGACRFPIAEITQNITTRDSKVEVSWFVDLSFFCLFFIINNKKLIPEVEKDNVKRRRHGQKDLQIWKWMMGLCYLLTNN